MSTTKKQPVTTRHSNGPDWIKTPYNAKQFPRYAEVNTLPSMTIPDQTMSLKVLLERFARGLKVTGEKFPIYHGEEAFPDLAKMDLSEIHALKKQVDEDVREQQAELMRQQHEADQKLAEENEKIRFKKWKDEEEKAKGGTTDSSKIS